jgi:carboxypeptidase Q
LPVIAEVVGREHPEQVIVIGGHIDSWDPAQGAQDDGGGVMIAWETIRLIKELGLIPRRTIRCVLWTNEENGGRGGSQYYADHVGDMANHIAAIESDSGVYAPTGMGWASKKPNGYHYMENLFQRFVTHQLHVKMIMGGGGADISPMTSNGVPGLSTENAASRSDPWQYFWIHHTYADTFDKIDQGEMNQNLAMLAATAYLLAELEQPLPRD